VSALI
jgi:translation initiation factor 2 subunit 1